MFARLLARIQAWRSHKAAWLAVAVAAVMAVIATLLTYNFPALANAEQYLADLWVAGFAPPEPQDSDIVVVSITEDTLSRFPYRAPLDRKFIAELLEKVASEHPKAIGVDYLFDQPTEEDKDKKLKDVLRSIDVPLVVAYVQVADQDVANVVSEDQNKYLDEFVPEKLRGIVNIPTDQFDVVRGVYPGAPSKDGYIPSFARALAEAVGVKTAPEEIPIAWHGRESRESDAFSEIPAQALSVLPPTLLQDKIVLIGADITLTDRHRTPFSTLERNGQGMAGVMIQAHTLSQLLKAKRAPRASWPVDLIVAFGLGLLGAAFGMIKLSVPARVAAGFGALIAFWAGVVGLYHFGGPMLGLIAPTLSLGTSFFAMEAASGSEARAQREFIKGVFSHHVAPKVVDQLLSDPTRVASLEGERRTMTFLFTDVADFTSMSEGVESKELGRILNLYLEGMTDIVQTHNGMVDKFIGDAVFAIFNAPIDQPDHAQAAVKCALEMDAFGENFSAAQHRAGIPFGRTRIGVHTGTAVIGNFGSRTRHNYTASGDAVNTASRLEGLNKHFGTRISVSGETRGLCHGIAFRPTASVVVKGRKTAIDLWEPLRPDDPRLAYLDRYLDAYEKLKTGAEDGGSLFEALAEDAPTDPSVAFHIGRIRHGVTNVSVVMTEK